MSDENEPTPDSRDPLLRALGDLPAPAMDGPHEARSRRAARAAFLREFDAPWHVRLFAGASRVALPLGLAAIVGIYLMWAIGTATALAH